MNTFKVYFWPSYGQDLNSIYDRYFTKNKEGVFEFWSKLYPDFLLHKVNSPDEADIIVLTDKVENFPTRFLNKKLVWFGREPTYVEKIDPPTFMKDNEIFSHNLENSWLPQTWWVDVPTDFTYENHNVLPPIPKKIHDDRVSIIDSGKSFLPGHKKRLLTYRKFLTSSEILSHIMKGILKVDTFGSGFGKPLPARTKNLGLNDYCLNLAIENGISKCYFSEKLVDPILLGCAVVYLGCYELQRFFPGFAMQSGPIHTIPLFHYTPLVDPFDPKSQDDLDKVYDAFIDEAECVSLNKPLFSTLDGHPELLKYMTELDFAPPQNLIYFKYSLPATVIKYLKDGTIL